MKLPPQHTQRQDCLNDQIKTVEEYFANHSDAPMNMYPLHMVRSVANKLGCYDAADYYRLYYQ